MKEIISIYKKQYSFIENSLTAMIESIDANEYDTLVKDSLFSLFPALQASYKISKNLKQSTPLYTPHEDDKTYLGLDKSHLLERIQFREDNIYIAHSDTNQLLIIPYSNLTIEKSIKASAKF